MQTIIVKVNNATQVIAEHAVVNQEGKPTVIKASQKVNYELFNTETGHAPQRIVTKRVDDDLHVSMQGDGEESDLIIEGFYDETDSALIGLAEDGQYHYYLPDSGEVADYVTELIPGIAEGQTLGGESYLAPWWVGATQGETFNALPWLVGLAGVGIVGAASSSGGSSSSSSVPPSQDKDKLLSDAKDAIDKVVQAEKDAQDALDKAKEDGVITPEEQQAIEDANKALEDAKQEAKDKIDQLPDSTGKTELQEQLDKIGGGVDVPEVTDKDGDGLDDAAAEDAQDAIDKVVQAEKEAQDALDKAKEDGVITPEEQQAIEDANQALEDAKKEAQDKIDQLPDSTGKTELQEQLDKIGGGVDVPDVTDKDGDGLDDAAAQDAQDAIDKVVQAEKDAQDALDKAKEDGVITPEEQQAIEDANKALEDAKQEAKDKIDQLPDSTGKTELQEQLDKIGGGVDVPEVTDENKDGVDDATAETIQGLINDAKDAEQAAKDKLKEVSEDGLITPTDQKAIEDANKAVAEAKDKAQQEINKLDPSKGKETLQGNLDAVNGVEVPAANDVNEDGLDDATAEQIQGLIDDAAAAEQAAKDALDKANADGLITPDEKQAIVEANQAVEDAKDKAQQAIDELDPSKGKDTLQDNLAAINGVDEPQVNDENKDGVNDATAETIQGLINDAKDAEQAAKEALDKANADGSINQQEHDDLQDLQDKVEAAKKEAQDAISKLEPSKGKEGLQAKLGEVEGIVVPAVTDSTGDGLDDAAAEEAQDAIDKAKDAQQAAQDALDKAKEDGVITPEEQQAIEDANKALEDAKKEAQDKIDQLPDSTGKDDLQGQLNEIGNGVDVPEATDKDGDGVDDATAETIQGLIDKAIAAEEAAKAKLEEVKGEDGLITPAEQEAVENANKAVAEAKDKAQQEINKLDPSKGKEALQDKLDAVNGVEVPAVNDKNSDDINDLTDAQNKVAAAEEAQREAEQALKAAEANGSITQQEHDDLQDLQDKVVAAKQAAQEAINLLDPSKDKEGLQAKLGEVEGIVVPAVTDVTPPETLDAEFNKAGTQVIGKTEAGATVEIKDANGSIIGTAVADEQGDYTADLTTPLTNGETVTVTATDEAGNTTDPVDATAPDNTAPEAPVVEISEDGTSVTVTGEEGASVTIILPNDEELTGTIENGSFTTDLTTPLTNGEEVSATLMDGSDNESVASTATAPDLTAPESVTAKFNEAGTQVTGKTEAGATVEIKDANGSIIGTAVADEQGDYTADLTTPLTNGETVTVTATDEAGNTTDPVDATAPDSTAPAAPVVGINEDGTQVTVTGEKGASVSITVPGVEEPIIGTIGEEGSFTTQLDPALTNGEEVSVTLKDSSGNTSESGTATAPDLTGPDSITAEITDNGAAVTGQTEAGATVEVKDAAGETIGTTKANADGSYTILLSPALINSETITVTATDIAGNTGKSVEAVAPDLTAPSVPTIEVPEPTGANGEYNKGDVDENGNVTVTIKLPDDAEVDDVLILNGQEITITEDMLTEGHQESVKPGSEVTASVKDAAGNQGMSATKQLATADTIAPEAPIITVPVPSAGADTEYNKGDVNDDGTITVNIKPRPDAQIDDVLTIVVEGSQPDEEVIITEDILLNGHDINVQPGSKVTASVTDKAGNEGVTASQTVATADVDISTPQIGLQNDTGTDGDGITNDGTLSITGTDEGDEIVSVVAVKADGSRLTLDASGGSYVLPEGEYEKVVVTTQDAAGNTATAETGAITVIGSIATPSIGLATDTGASNTDGITSNGTLVIEDNGDDIVSVIATPTDGSEAMTIEADESGNYVLPEGEYEKVEVTTQDEAGNTATVATGAITVDSNIEAPEISLQNDTGAENTDGITNDGTLVIDDKGDEIVSVVAVKADGLRLTLDASGGSYVLPEGEYEKVVVTTQDAAGNTATAETGAITVDKTSPSLNISVDIIAEDDIVNAAEAGSTITITGHVTGEYNADDTVTLTVNGNSNYSGKVTDEGSFSIEVAGSDLAEDSKVGVSVTTTDTAGNQGTATAERPYEVDVVVPGQPIITFPENIDDNEYINIEENGTGYNASNTPIRVTLPEGTEAGDIIELSTKLTDENSLETTQSIKVIVSETDITNGYAERLVNINSDTTGSTLEVTATVTDAAGNTSQDGTASIMIDTIAPQVAIEFDGIESSGSDSESYIATDSKHEVSFIFNEPVENFDLSKVNITSGGGTLSDLTGPIEINGEYVFKAIYTAPSSIPIGQESIEIELSIGNDVATDAAGNGNKDANDENNKVQIVVSKPAELESLVITDDFISSSRPGFENTASNHYGVEGAYTGVVADSSVSNDQTELKGITNDTTPVVSIVLDGPVLQGQKVTVTGMQVDSQNNIIGDPIELDIANASMETNRVTGQVTYSWANEALPITDTKGREFVYKASITEVDGVTETANKEVSFILDTVAESPVVTGYDIIDGQGVITGKYSEPGGKVFVDVNKNGIFNQDEGEIAATVDQNGEWKLTLTIEQTKMIADIKNYNGSRFNPEVIEGGFDTYLPLSFVDKAGNTSTEFAEFYYFNNNDNGALSTSDLVPADRPETATGGWIEGQTGDYDGDGVGNWELRFDQNDAGQIILVERNIATYFSNAANRFNIVTGKGDDVMIIKGVQNTYTSVYMGEGNDVYSIGRLAGSGNVGSIVVDMGSGHNKILINGQAANDAIDLSTIKALGGDDVLDVTGGGIRRSNIDLGDGNNQILTYNLGGLGTTNITTGKDNDYLKVDNAVSSTNINLGDGVNKIDINKYINSSTSINTGKHADTVNIGTSVSGSSTINLGGGNNTLTIGESVSGSSTITAGEHADTVNIGTSVSGSSTINLGDGENTLTIGESVSGSASIITTGIGKDTVDIKTYVDNATIKLGDGGSELNIGTSVTSAAQIVTGSGKDIVNIGTKVEDTSIDLGDGDNTLSVGTWLNSTSTIRGGINNDSIRIGYQNSDVAQNGLWNSSKIEIAGGNNTIDINGQVRNNALITTGSGNDDIKVVGDLWVSNIKAGNGDNTIDIKGKVIATETNEAGYGEVITGTGKDTITVSGDLQGKNVIISSGAGGDTVSVGGYVYAEAKIYTGEGRDTVSVNYLGSSGGAPLVDTGADNDDVTIGTFSKGDIVLGTGEDKLSITTMTGGTVYTGTKEANEDNEVDTVKVDNLQGGTINLGVNDVISIDTMSNGTVKSTAGANQVTVTKEMSRGTLDLGAGDDTVTIEKLSGGNIYLADGDDTINLAGFSGGSINGGAGHDVLNLTGEGINLTANNITAIEVLDLGTGDAGNKFTGTLAQVSSRSLSGLYIKGDENDTVDLKSGLATWNKSETTVQDSDGNQYYEYRGTQFAYTDQVLYIDVDITNVII